VIEAGFHVSQVGHIWPYLSSIEKGWLKNKRQASVGEWVFFVFAS